jgi:pyruvate,orthophosphate dikinase
MGKVCIVGCSALQIDYNNMTVKVGSHTLNDGDWISIDGFTGEVMAGKVATKPSEVVQVLIEKSLKPAKAPVYKLFEKVMKWADKVRKLDVRTNADTAKDAESAIAFGAEGIGLCRTEHMFFDHIREMREMILATDEKSRKVALEKLLPFQRDGFAGLFRTMNGLPVTVRTLDPPLHEFLPHDHKGQVEMAGDMNVSVEEIERRVKSLHEFNPMLGFRGCRLGIVFPEITEMQARAIFEAACIVKKEGIEVYPEIMIPLVGFKKELDLQAAVVHAAAKTVFKEQGITIEYLVGTMIELPRAAMAAAEIAETAQFFSFGTNDLTQTGLGMSRDDYGSFINQYQELEVVKKDPFQVIDFAGIGKLMEIGVQGGRSTKKDLKVGICGEHGGEPDSVKFCHKIGLNYVSCSPYRVPVARLAAAQAVLEEQAARAKAKAAKEALAAAKAKAE